MKSKEERLESELEFIKNLCFKLENEELEKEGPKSQGRAEAYENIVKIISAFDEI